MYEVVTNGKVFRIRYINSHEFVGTTTYLDALFTYVPCFKPTEYMTKEEAQAWVDKHTWKPV